MTSDATAALATVLYYLVAAGKGDALRSFDCARCGHAELGRPVFLATSPDGAGSRPYGSGCAAILLYGDARHAGRVRNEADGAAITAAALEAEAALVAGIAAEWIAAADAAGAHLADVAHLDPRFDALRIRIAKGIAAGRIAPGLAAEVARLAAR